MLIQRGPGAGVTTSNTSRGVYSPLPSTPRGSRRKNPRPATGMPYNHTVTKAGNGKVVAQ